MTETFAARLLVTNIQRFSLHDGPGIRTTVFLKGCSLHCPWCANPENISHNIEKYYKDGKYGEYGKWYSCEELYAELIKDVSFFRESEEKTALNSYRITSFRQLKSLPGGVTFSGGEPLLQIQKMEPLLERLRGENIHLAVETSLFSSKESLNAAIKYIDLFYVDIKLLEANRCLTTIKGDLETYKANLSVLLNSGCPIVFRIPVISEDAEHKNGTLDESNQRLVAQMISESLHKGNVLKVELIKEHNLGLTKYQALKDGGSDVVIPRYHGVSDAQMESYRNLIVAETPADKRIPVEICKI